MYNNFENKSKKQDIIPNKQSLTKKLSLKKSSTIKPSLKKSSTIKPSLKKPSLKKSSTIKPSTIKPSTIKPSTIKPSTIKPSTIKPSTIKPINNNKIVTYAIGSSIVRFHKNTITIYTNTEFDYNILYDTDFISKFNIKNYKSSTSNHQLLSNELLNQKLNNTIYFTTNFKISNINTIQKNNTFTNINSGKNIWTIQTYNYNGNIFISDKKSNDKLYYSFTYPNFINNNIHTTYILVNLYDNIYLSISSYKIELFRTTNNDKIISIKEYYTKSSNQNLLLVSNTYSYYMCVPYPEDDADAKSFYISNENYKKYNMSMFLYNTIVYKNNTNSNSNSNTNIQNNKWSFIYKLPIKKKMLGITYYNYKEMEINNVLYELIPLFSMRNHNYTFN